MIDEKITYSEKGYRSTDLSHGSNKPVWAVCEGEDCEREGGRGRWVKLKDYRKLCHLCAMRTEERRAKIVSANTGRKHTDEDKIKIRENHADVSGENNPMYGMTGKNSPIYGIKRSIETLITMSNSQKGEKGSNWKGGITPENEKFRKSFEYKHWRKSVFERDDYTCQECGERGGSLNAHHILPYRDWREPRFSLNIKNGITLCEKCHNKTKGNEYEFFNKYFDIANGITKGYRRD